ncbi:Phosphatidylinositol:ceramide phosphoinositol transferase (IPC synthase) [Malassezia sp. CBS 17886]|nr:Phosphatidylinositol:ceramide phosphoinositol transferase (IPC synthase) [Malassezia sp. CBS 17886]
MSTSLAANAGRSDSLVKRVLLAVRAAASRLSLSTSPSENVRKLRDHRMSPGEKVKYGFMFAVALFSVTMIQEPPLPYKLVIPLLYVVALLLPITSQFILPASPILLWLLLFYSCRFIPASARPHIWVSVLPTLETVWYGASISDILTRFGHPLLDILAWIPYGVVHFVAPFVVAALLFVYAPVGSVKVFATSFGFTNLLGVLIQIGFPCAPPWYELREGLMPADYSMRGSPAGLARIDAIFSGHGYTLTFTGAPVVFGAFPSLHAACATCESLFLSYFFPGKLRVGRWALDLRVLYWGYSFWLYWCTMYLMHHYLIDLVAVFRTEDVRDAMEQRIAAMERAETGEPRSSGPEVLSMDALHGKPIAHTDDASWESPSAPHDEEAGRFASASVAATPVFTVDDGEEGSHTHSMHLTASAVDPANAMLSVLRADTNALEQVRRADLVDVCTAPPPAPVSQTSSPAPSRTGTPHTDGAGGADATAAARKKKGGKKGRTAAATTPSPAAAATPPPAATPQGAPAAPPVPPQHPYEDEFDFTKSTQSFDKKKIWEEIRNKEATTGSRPDLLVTLNRNPAAAAAPEAPASQQKQPMLAPTEMVLTEPERADAADPAAGRAAALEEELRAANAQNAQLRAQVALLEVLSGQHLAPAAGEETWSCTLFAEPRVALAHWRAKYADAPAPDTTGTLRYTVHAPAIGTPTSGSLRYGGPQREASDASLMQQLPEHFQDEISFKLDNAALFQRRLADLIRGG